MRLYVNQPFLDLLRARRIYTGSGGNSAWRVGDILLVDDEAEIEPYSHIMEGRVLPHRLGAFSYSYAALGTQLSIGRYCSIGPRLSMMGSQHPAEWLTTSPLTYVGHLLDGIDAYYADRDQVRPPLLPFDAKLQGISIGHDVWIGGEVMIRRGITIGHGAIIAARAVVTKDVPPYAVVAGVPARILKYRFPESVIESLLASEWWNYGPDVISALDVREPERLPDRLADAISAGAQPLALTPLTARDMIRAVQPSTT